MHTPEAVLSHAMEAMPARKAEIDSAFAAFLAHPSNATAKEHLGAIERHAFIRDAANRAFAAFIAKRLGDLAAERTQAKSRKAANLAEYLKGARTRLAAKRAESAHPTDAHTVYSTQAHYLVTLEAMAQVWCGGPGVEPPRQSLAASEAGIVAYFRGMFAIRG